MNVPTHDIYVIGTSRVLGLNGGGAFWELRLRHDLLRSQVIEYILARARTCPCIRLGSLEEHRANRSDKGCRTVAAFKAHYFADW